MFASSKPEAMTDTRAGVEDELAVRRGGVSGPRNRTMQQRRVWASGGSDLRDQELADQHGHPEQTERNE